MGAASCAPQEAFKSQTVGAERADGRRVSLVSPHGAAFSASTDVAKIHCVSNEESEKCEHAARQLAVQAEQAAIGPLLAGVEANGGGQLLLLRSLHFLQRRMALLESAAAVREADANNPADGLLIQKDSQPLPVGVHPLLMPAPGNELLNLGQDPGNLGRDNDDAPSVKLTPGFTYVFESSTDGADVNIREMLSESVYVEFPEEGQSESGLGSWRVDGVKEEVFIKDKQPELDGGGMPLLLRQVTLEAATCATLAPLDVLVKLRAVQIFEDRVRMLFKRLPGRSFDDFLDALEAQNHRASESEILGGALLALGSYAKLNFAGFSQRDAKSENLWLSVCDNILRVVVTDSEAVFKAGHIEDAHMDGVGNEAWQLRALRDRKLWRFGGSTFSRAVSIFAANVDLQSKQCCPGEQAIVYSLTEIILRMMGESAKAMACGDDSRWEDVVAASFGCDLFSDSDDEPSQEEEGGAKEKVAKADGKAQPSTSSFYSSPFLNLVMTLRRRSFTQGGVDAFLDLGQALQLCRDYIKERLHSTDAACLGDFAKLVGQMASVRPTAAAQEDTGVLMTRQKSEDDGDVPEGSNRLWSELSEKDMANYHVCPVTERVESKGTTSFQVVGLALRRRSARKFGSDMELHMKSPHTVGTKPQPVCFASMAWWRRLPEIEEIVEQCLRTRSRDLAGLGELLKKALNSTCRHPLRVHHDVLCFHLELSREHFRGHQGMTDWPLIALYPLTQELTHSVIENLREQVARRAPVQPKKA